MRNRKGFTLVGLVFAVVVCFCLIGEGLCVYRLTQCDFEAPYKAEIIYGASLVTGFGSIVGYIDLGK